MRYADLTTNDPNVIKRYLQRRRFADAIALIGDRMPRDIVDFGAGNGELCRGLSERFPDSRIICYEPAEVWRLDALENLRGVANVTVVPSIDGIAPHSCDVVFCMEVFEHLPPVQTREALRQIKRLLADGGLGIIGVPIEIFAPALIKGVFRMIRRYGEFDATPGAVLCASLGIPPTERPLHQVGPGLSFHHFHMGFDHRRFRDVLGAELSIVRTAGSPARWLGTLLNSELYFVVRQSGTQ
jgi:SAM-dependent methyltransferase